MRSRRYLTACSFALALLVARAADAQLGSTSSSSAPADSSGVSGIRLGDRLVLHLVVGTEIGWDSNVFYTPSTGTPGPVNSFYLRLTPGFDLTTRPRNGIPVVQFDFHGGLGYVEYLNTNSDIQRHR